MPKLKVGSVTHPVGIRRFIVKLPDSLVGTMVILDDEWGNKESGIAGDKPEYGIAAIEFIGSTASHMIVRVYDYSYQVGVPYPTEEEGRGTFLTLAFAPPEPEPPPDLEPGPEPPPEPPPMTEAEFFEKLLAKLDEIISIL